MHLWWARRPLASSRAMLLALLLPDPADPACPTPFKADARAALQNLPNMGGTRGTDDLRLRDALLRFIGDCADWNRSADMIYLTAARALIHAAHGEDTPLVVDPFAGGGSIPLEALRLGCDVYASDLNPVACLILKTMLEDVPRHGPGLAEKVRVAGAEIRAAAERELGRFIHRTQTARGRSRISGRAPCAARQATAVPKFPWRGRSGWRPGEAGVGRCVVPGRAAKGSPADLAFRGVRAIR